MQVDRIALLFLACAACSSGAPPDRGAVPDATGADARDVVASDTSPSGAADAADDKAPDTPAPDAQDAADHAASDARGPDAPDAPHGTRYLALGDSYTIGQSVDEADRFPVQLVARLRADGVDIAGPEIIARTGWTTDELDGGIDAAGPRGPYALVTLLIGVNNQYRGRPVETYTPEFTALLQRSIGIAGDDPGRVVVVSIPDYGATPFGQRGDPARTGRTVAGARGDGRDGDVGPPDNTRNFSTRLYG